MIAFKIIVPVYYASKKTSEFIEIIFFWVQNLHNTNCDRDTKKDYSC